VGKAAAAYAQALRLYAEIGGMVPLTSAAQAGLAGIALAHGDLAQARVHVEALVSVLTADGPVAVDEVGEIALICYHVLEASGDVRAVSLLQRAEQRLRGCAEGITDAALRRSFLEHVAAHHAILTLAHTTATPVGER
jgi:hypothetical protein